MISHGYVLKEEWRLRKEAEDAALAGIAKLINPNVPADLNVALMSLVYACAHLQSAIALRDMGENALRAQGE